MRQDTASRSENQGWNLQTEGREGGEILNFGFELEERFARSGSAPGSRILNFGLKKRFAHSGAFHSLASNIQNSEFKIPRTAVVFHSESKIQHS